MVGVSCIKIAPSLYKLIALDPSNRCWDDDDGRLSLLDEFVVYYTCICMYVSQTFYVCSSCMHVRCFSHVINTCATTGSWYLQLFRGCTTLNNCKYQYVHTSLMHLHGGA